MYCINDITKKIVQLQLMKIKKEIVYCSNTVYTQQTIIGKIIITKFSVNEKCKMINGIIF